MKTATLSLLALAAGVGNASPQRRASSCTFTDAAKVAAGKSSCTNIVLSGISVPAGETLDLTGLRDGTTVTFEGTTTFGYKEWKGPLVSFSGNNINVKGASGHVIDGNGAKWWDSKGSNGGKTKPKFWFAHKTTNAVFSNLNIKNSPVQVFSINNAQNTQFVDITIDNSAGDAGGGHNTDAFDIGSSSGIYISGANVRNQDDCLAINSGSNITFTGGSCSGGHGLSIGSVGGRSDNAVSNVKITNSKVINSQNGVRIKTVSGATGSVKDVTYQGVTLQNISKYGIVIQQDYENGSPTGKPTTGVPITDVTMDGVTGDVEASATNIYILCGKGSCSDWKFSNVKVTGGKRGACTNVPSGASC